MWVYAHTKKEDMLNVLRRIVDVAVYLQELPKVLEFLDGTENVSMEIEKLTELLTQVKNRVSKYGKGKFSFYIVYLI